MANRSGHPDCHAVWRSRERTGTIGEQCFPTPTWLSGIGGGQDRAGSWAPMTHWPHSLLRRLKWSCVMPACFSEMHTERRWYGQPELPAVQKFAVPGSRVQTSALLSAQSAAANNARATDRACLVVRYSSWSADSHTPMSPFSFCTAATSAEKPSSPRRGGQCGP